MRRHLFALVARAEECQGTVHRNRRPGFALQGSEQAVRPGQFHAARLGGAAAADEVGSLLAGTAPHWIIALWALFATTLNLSLRWLHGRWWLSALFGAIAGPLAFYAGSRLGAVRFSEPAIALAWLALGWGLLTPLLMRLAQRFDGARTRLVEAA